MIWEEFSIYLKLACKELSILTFPPGKNIFVNICTETLHPQSRTAIQVSRVSRVLVYDGSELPRIIFEMLEGLFKW